MAKVRVATTWLECCSGCHMSFLDLDEKLVELLSKIEFDASPITDIKDFHPVDVGIVEGAVGNEEQLEVLKKIRENSKILIAMGDCACFGGIPAMRNFFNKDEVLKRVYVETESTVNPTKVIPHEDVPKLFPNVKAIDQFVKVDVYIPGCPPDPRAIEYVLKELLDGRIPVLPPELLSYE